MTEVFPCFFLSCKANARVTLAKTGHGPYSSKLFVICVMSLFVLFCCYCVVLLLFVLFCYYLCCSIYCLCVNVYCTTATGCLPNCSWQIYRIIYNMHYSSKYLLKTSVVQMSRLSIEPMGLFLCSQPSQDPVLSQFNPCDSLTSYFCKLYFKVLPFCPTMVYPLTLHKYL